MGEVGLVDVPGWGSGWKPIGIGDLLEPKKVKRAYYTSFVHPDKLVNLSIEQRAVGKRIFDGFVASAREGSSDAYYKACCLLGSYARQACVHSCALERGEGNVRVTISGLVLVLTTSYGCHGSKTSAPGRPRVAVEASAKVAWQ